MWVTDFPPRSWRAIAQWGDPATMSHPAKEMVALLVERLGIAPGAPAWSPGTETVVAASPDLAAEVLEEIGSIVGRENVSIDPFERARRSCGRSLDDLLRLRAGPPPRLADAVVFPRSAGEVERIVELAARRSVPIVPVGGATSVTRGPELPRGGISLDLTRHMNRILQLDETSGTVRVEAGVLGPALEKWLEEAKSAGAPDGWTVGHFPQSFEKASVGGWIAARGAGQESTGYGRIEDLALGQLWITPKGRIVVRSFPAVSVGPDLGELFLGSEGSFGVLVEATLRIRRRSRRRNFAFLFRSWTDAVDASREVMQGRFGLPTLFRISDPEETGIGLRLHRFEGSIPDRALRLAGYLPGQRALLLGSADGDADSARLVAKKIFRIARSRGAFPLGGGVVRSWLRTRFRDPDLRDDLLDLGVLVDTLETSVSWRDLSRLREAARSVVLARGHAIVMVHASHFYETGANLYVIILARIDPTDPRGDAGRLMANVVDAIRANGGSLSHHHGVGRLFAPWLEDEIGPVGLEILRGVKRTIDPAGVMNPGGTLALDEPGNPAVRR